MVDSESMVGSSTGSESAVRYDVDFASAARYVLGFGFETGSATEGCAQPTILQSTEGNFRHYDR